MEKGKTKLHHKSLIHQGRVFKLFREDITLPNGLRMHMDVIRHPGAAAIVALRDTDSVVLLRQYRYAAGQYLWEVPAGTLSPGEPPLECAKRELREETGFEAGHWEELGRIVPLPAYSDETIYIFLAQDLRETSQELDRDEILEVHLVALADVDSMILDGQIKDSKTISSLTLARLWLAKAGPRTPV